jgi:LDH2 family malate/lactate/ureidoglycolate dehydrogenase
VGLVVIRNGNHFGAGATWVEEIVLADLIGIAACNTFPVMAPWGGRDARLGTNPLAVGVPCGSLGPWLLDMATSTVAMSKLLIAHRKGEKSIPAGWALDANGAPTTEVRAALKGGTLLPMGGVKGAGIAMLIDILSGVLSGGAFGTDVGAFNVGGTATRTSAFIAAIDVGAFMPMYEFKERMDAFISMMSCAAPAAGFERIAAPGQPEAAAAAHRQKEGIPIGASLFDALQGIASKANAKLLVRH